MSDENDWSSIYSGVTSEDDLKAVGSTQESTTFDVPAGKLEQPMTASEKAAAANTEAAKIAQQKAAVEESLHWTQQNTPEQQKHDSTTLRDPVRENFTPARPATNLSEAAINAKITEWQSRTTSKKS